MTQGRVIAIVAVVALAAGACSSGRHNSSSGSPATGRTTTTVNRPTGPAADLSQELHGGTGVFLPGGSAPTGAAQAPPGYVISEYAASGTATSYRIDGALTFDGRWNFVAEGSA